MAVRTLNDAICGSIYDPLDESIDSIRLLSFEEGCNGDGVIRCNLVHVTFGQKPVYDALSYTWGEATDQSHTIFINGKPFTVRDNLFKILKSFSSHRLRDIETPDPYGFDRDLASRLLWIDAICS
ncbi:hypothetical protein EG329_009912 [Mollisiaceae sp. DMI_Dod_QoI]|nr:hypothetical protein EG329_009912 [Helotiales sp. DMI_Dod_QoI]